jgi:TetR/AcrR family transcriptional repressor of nem operon
LRRRLAIVNQTVQNEKMARPIEFDRSKALNRALVLFWRKGYQATSLADLLNAMGIGRSSLYAAFGDKRSLFVECLDLFSDRTRDVLQRTCAGKPPIEALQDFFERNVVGVDGAGAVRRHWGCMLVNTVLEMAGVDDGLAAHASRRMAGMQRFFEDRLQEAGATAARAEELAEMLVLFNEGVRVSSRRRLPDAHHVRPIDTLFRLIRLAITEPALER